MELYTAPEEVPFGLPMVDSVFLAGSIEQGKARDWQTQVIDALQNIDCVIFNPRRTAWDATWEQTTDNPEFVKQVNWELDNLDRADVVFFYFQAGTMSPISLAELGLVLQKCADDNPIFEETVVPVVVCEPGFWRKGNVDIMCGRAGVEVYETLEQGIEVLLGF